MKKNTTIKLSINISIFAIGFAFLVMLAIILLLPTYFDSFDKILSFIILSSIGFIFIYFSIRSFSAFIEGFGYNQFWTADIFNKIQIFRSKKDTNIFSRINSLLISVAFLLIGVGLIIATFLRN